MDVFGKHHHGGGGVDPIPTIVPDPTDFQVIGDGGIRLLWVLFVAMALATALFALLSWNVPIARRVFYVITTLTTLISALAYFAMASGSGSSFNCTVAKDHHKHVPDTHHDVCRQVFWVHYVDWALTLPLLLFELGLLAGVSGGHTLLAVVANLVMVLGGLFSAFGRHHTAQKWGWYAIACVAYVFVIWHVALHGFRGASARSNKVSKLFGSLSVFALLLWAAYLIVWGVAPGARKTSVNSELIAYAVLDVLSKPIFGLWLLFAQRQDRDSGLDVGGYWAHGVGGEGRIRIGEGDDGA